MIPIGNAGGSADLHSKDSIISALKKERDYWKAKAEANEKDAERYRWLRAQNEIGRADIHMQGLGLDLDTAIDAARSAEKEQP